MFEWKSVHLSSLVRDVLGRVGFHGRSHLINSEVVSEPRHDRVGSPA